MSVDNIFGDERLELSDLLSHVLDKGVVLKGEVMLAVADIDLVRLDLGLLLTAVETVLGRGGGLAVPERAGLLGAAGPRERPVIVPSGSTMESQVVRTLDAPKDAAITPLETVAEGLPPRLNTDPDKVENGLAKLVLTLIEVLRKVLEHQAVRRMEGGHLSDEEVERLGVALLRLNDRMQDMKGIFGLTDDDLQIDLGPLGRLR
ncbi:MAG TPA: gas vesicle protein GvpJ [Gemmatimonadaceae bacterium]|nr:gas vesicle protein GvpJ [Gemmatimonadaceae bacterium]